MEKMCLPKDPAENLDDAIDLAAYPPSSPLALSDVFDVVDCLDVFDDVECLDEFPTDMFAASFLSGSANCTCKAVWDFG